MKINLENNDNIDCPICSSSNFKELINNDRYNMKIKTVGCINCGLIFSNPMPSDRFIEEFYKKNYRKYYQNTDTPSEKYIHEYMKKERISYTADFIYARIINSSVKSICDIGSSEGLLLSEIRRRGFDGLLLGIEPNTKFSKYSNDIKIYEQIEYAQDNSIDCITSIHSFEHMKKPNEVLQKIKKILKPNGLIFIDIPDADAYKSLESFHIAHLYHYTTTTIQYILSKSGFNILFIEKHAPPHHPASIRIIATPSDNHTHYADLYNNNDIVTWNEIEQISIIKYFLRKTASRIISKIPYGRAIYNFIKK